MSQTKAVEELIEKRLLERAESRTGIELYLEECMPAAAKSAIAIIPPHDLELPAETADPESQDGYVYADTRVVTARYQGREVSLKLVHCDYHTKPRVRRELEALARLAGAGHAAAHALRPLGVSFLKATHEFALVLPLYGRTLAEEIAAQPGGRMSPGAVLLLARDLLRCLAALHAAGVAHSDLQPGTVLLDGASGVPLLADFGSAVLVEGGAEGGPQAGGTPNYMAPEQFAPRSQCHLASDMWALGCTLLHALTGAAPWQGLAYVRIAEQVVRHRGRPPVPGGLTPALSSLLAACLRVEPEGRPSAAGALGELERDLRAVLNGQGAGAAGGEASPGAAAADLIKMDSMSLV